MTAAVWITSGRDDERGRVPGDDQHRSQRDLRPDVPGQQPGAQVAGDRPGGPRQPRPAAMPGRATPGRAAHDERRAGCDGRQPPENVRQRGPHRRRQDQQHDGGRRGLDDLAAQPFQPHRPQAPHHVP
jgi:hypothetical protein